MAGVVNRSEWFKRAIHAERWKEPGWLLQLFCVTELTSMRDEVVDHEKPPAPYSIYSYMDDKQYCYYDPEHSEFIPFEKSNVTEPLFKFSDRIKLVAGDLPNVSNPIDTTVGNTVINLYMLIYPFGAAFPFFTGKTDGEDIQKQIETAAQESEREGSSIKITPAQITQYKKSTLSLQALATAASASGSAASFTIHQEVLDLRDKLFEENKEHLDNPAVVAEIEKKCVAFDTELRKGDVSDGFFMGSKKLQSIGRKKQLISYGMEGGLGGDPKLIKHALSDGMDYKLIPLYADTATAASQSRGLLTAQGGELVKYNLRMFQNSHVSEDDCGTRGYIDFYASKTSYKLLINRYIFDEKGATVLVTDELAKKLIGKRVRLRSPGYCLAKGRDFCKKCVDVNIAERPDGIATTTSEGTNKIMNDAMKAMHGSIPESFIYDIFEHNQ